MGDRGLVRAAGGSGSISRGDDPEGGEDLTDGILIRRDPHHPRAAEIWLDGDSRVGEILDAVAGGRIRGLIVCGWEAEALGERGGRALAAAEWVLFVGPRRTSLLEHPDLALPTCVHVERDGTFTNYAGRVQRFWPNVGSSPRPLTLRRPCRRVTASGWR